MSDSAPRLTLVCYDIRDPRRLIRVHRFLRNEGFPVQYSVFTVPLTPRRLKWLLGELTELIDERVDDVRAYPLPTDPERVTYGRQRFPDGVMLLSAGGDLLHPGCKPRRRRGNSARHSKNSR